jgi:hypothetical protein
MKRFHSLSASKAPEYGFALVYPEVIQHLQDTVGKTELVLTDENEEDYWDDVHASSQCCLECISTYIYIASKISGSQPYPRITLGSLMQGTGLNNAMLSLAITHLVRENLLNVLSVDDNPIDEGRGVIFPVGASRDTEANFEVYTILPKNGIKRISYKQQNPWAVPSRVANRRS